MPTPYRPPLQVPNPTPLPVPDPQGWAIDQERRRHEGALYSFGEYAVFVLMWNPVDFDAGLVDRCSECMEGSEMAKAYGQADQYRCPTCFGTTFEGGWKARLVRPAMWDDAEVQDSAAARGFVEMNSAAVQSTSDFRMRNGDYIFRADGTRWQVRTISGTNLVTGFGHASRESTILGFNYGQCSLEDPSDVSYLIPPTEGELTTLLDIQHAHGQTDFTEWDELRGPVL